MQLTVLTNTVITMLLLILAGFGAAKLGIIDKTASKKLSALIINVGQPFLMVSSLLESEFSIENLKLGLFIVLLAAGIHTVTIAISLVSTIGLKNINERQITRFSMVFANNAFYGYPILRAVFGAKGVFWGSFYCVFFNVLLWTWGMFVLSRANRSIKMSPLKILFNLGTLSVSLGLIYYVARIPVIEPMRSAMEYLGGLCTPITMLICGAAISRIPLKQLFLKPLTYYMCLAKLIVAPLLIGTAATLLGLGRDMTLFAALMAGMPTAANTSAFAEQYDIVPEYASCCVGLSTVLSVITVPMTVLIFG